MARISLYIRLTVEGSLSVYIHWNHQRSLPLFREEHPLERRSLTKRAVPSFNHRET